MQINGIAILSDFVPAFLHSSVVFWCSNSFLIVIVFIRYRTHFTFILPLSLAVKTLLDGFPKHFHSETYADSSAHIFHKLCFAQPSTMNTCCFILSTILSCIELVTKQVCTSHSLRCHDTAQSI